MRRLVKFLFLGALMQSALVVAQTVSTKEAIALYFGANGAPPQLKRQKSIASVEVCFDTCDFYRFGGQVDEQVVWDVVFLHQYFVNTAYHIKKFNSDYQAVTTDVLAKYKSECPTESKQATCVLDHLAQRHRISYAFVRYDEGYRCQVAKLLTNPSFEGKSSCTRYGNAP